MNSDCVLVQSNCARGDVEETPNADILKTITLWAYYGPDATSFICWPRYIWPVTFPRQRRRTLMFMMALAVIGVVATALGIGYRFGRHAGAAPSTWKIRTSRGTLCRLAISLIVLMIARRVQRSFRAGNALS